MYWSACVTSVIPTSEDRNYIANYGHQHFSVSYLAVLRITMFSVRLFILQIPESPAWLVYMGKTRKAEEALCWLRGWVTPDKVQKELNVLVKHVDSTEQNKPSDAEGL